MFNAVSHSLFTPRSSSTEVSRQARELISTLAQVDGTEADLAPQDRLVELHSGKDQMAASFYVDQQNPNFHMLRKLKVDGQESVTSLTVNGSDVQGLELTRNGQTFSGVRYSTDDNGYLISNPISENKVKLQWVLATSDLGLV